MDQIDISADSEILPWFFNDFLGGVFELPFFEAPENGEIGFLIPNFDDVFRWFEVTS